MRGSVAVDGRREIEELVGFPVTELERLDFGPFPGW